MEVVKIGTPSATDPTDRGAFARTTAFWVERQATLANESIAALQSPFSGTLVAPALARYVRPESRDTHRPSCDSPASRSSTNAHANPDSYPLADSKQVMLTRIVEALPKQRSSRLTVLTAAIIMRRRLIQPSPLMRPLENRATSRALPKLSAIQTFPSIGDIVVAVALDGGVPRRGWDS
jgi:hypothetical protein